MRLQLISAAVTIAFAVYPVDALATLGDGGGVRTDVYADEWIVVISPAASASVDLGRRFTLGSGFAVDVLSGATPIFSTDAITAATSFSEIRRDAHVSGTVTFIPEARLDAAYAVSIEPDHEAHSATLAPTAELFGRTVTATASYRFVHEFVGRSDDPHYAQISYSHLMDLSWVQVATRTTTVSILGSSHWSRCASMLGCQANPYRRVPLLTERGELPSTTVPERHPSQRWRGALSGRIAQYLGHELALHAGYRFYADTWSITGHTGDIGLAWALFDQHLVLRPETRVAWQSRAGFFLDDYIQDPQDAVPAYRTGDRELSELLSVTATLRVEQALPTFGPLNLRVNARASRVAYRYATFRELPRRNAWLVGVGLMAEI